MAICNLFNELTKTNGTFLTFSQYSEDLTEMNTQPGSYRVSPSKFITFNLDMAGDNWNKDFPIILRNCFENGCAYLREQPDILKNLGKSRQEMSKILFWNTLYENGIINIIEENATDIDGNEIISNYIKEINYVGDINLQSYNEYDGMGYSEIYCHIPNDANGIKYYVLKNDDDIEIIKYDKHHLVGWSDIEISNLYYLNNYKFIYDKSINHNDDFEFNAIAVFYNILKLDNEGNITTIHEDIPMGIYITGLFDENGLNNKVQKIVNSEEIYSTGSSYGLRICSRFTTIGDSNVDINIDSSNDYVSISTLLSELSKTHEKMNDVIGEVVNQSSWQKSFMNSFKNYRTNIPYIKKVGDTDYWFVNGIKMAPTTIYNENPSYPGGQSCSCSAVNDKDIIDIIQYLEGDSVINTLWFNIGNIRYWTDEYMNWVEWIESDYNKDNSQNKIFEIVGDNVRKIGTDRYVAHSDYDLVEVNSLVASYNGRDYILTGDTPTDPDDSTNPNELATEQELEDAIDHGTGKKPSYPEASNEEVKDVINLYRGGVKELGYEEIEGLGEKFEAATNEEVENKWREN